MTRAVVELVHAESRARQAVRLRGEREPRRHALFEAQQRAHENQVAVAHLRLPDEVVVAQGDGRKCHIVGHSFIQHGDVVILVKVYDPVDYLQQESGQGHGEDHRPQTLADAELLVLHKHVVGAVQRAAAEESGQVVHLADVVAVPLPAVIVHPAALVQVFLRVPVTVTLLHPSVVVVEAGITVPTGGLVVGSEGDGAHDPDRHGGGDGKSMLSDEMISPKSVKSAYWDKTISWNNPGIQQLDNRKQC